MHKRYNVNLQIGSDCVLRITEERCSGFGIRKEEKMRFSSIRLLPDPEPRPSNPTLPEPRIPNTVLLLMCSLLLLPTVGTYAADSPDFSAILQQITKAESEIPYMGVRLAIRCTPSGCSVQEELVIHEPPDTHFIGGIKSAPKAPSTKAPDPTLRNDEDLPKRRGPWWDRRGGQSPTKGAGIEKEMPRNNVGNTCNS